MSSSFYTKGNELLKSLNIKTNTVTEKEEIKASKNFTAVLLTKNDKTNNLNSKLFLG